MKNHFLKDSSEEFKEENVYLGFVNTTTNVWFFFFQRKKSIQKQQVTLVYCLGWN